jgi:FtsH-binding integral membrane protein
MTITEYLMNIALVGLVVLQIRGHKVTVARLLVPLVLTAWAASQFLHAIPTTASDSVLEVGFALVGAVLGGLAALATTVRRDGAGAFAKAGILAATLWVLGIGARVGFSFWVSHGGAPTITRFSVAHHITSGAAWAAAFILMAMVEVASRTGVLYMKARRSGAVIPRGGLLRSPAAA